eukprot:TRINITY_DN47140_c0_g1_i1.p1 TRINITY_DN47140_c0_g1~~TRINITY_DN47140_c0_g1_i1.p1  ORF type:complete len:549 (-),score=28.73 TRINITY_DN47140_c0_g1_i1:126-1772(-)
MSLAASYRWRVLLIGNDDYVNLPPLKASRNDVDLMCEVLTKTCALSSTPACKFNLASQDLSCALDDFVEDAPQGSANFIFYAGHGIETGDGTFAVGIDAEPDLSKSATHEMSFNHLLRRFRSQNTRGILFLALACCRESICAAPLRHSFASMTKRQTSLGDVCLHACRQGETIADAISVSPWVGGVVREHSLFAIDFFRAILLSSKFRWSLVKIAEQVCCMANERLRSGRKASPEHVVSFYGEAARENVYLTMPCLDGPSIGRISKVNGHDVVPAASMRPTVKECAELWTNECDLGIHPAIRHLELSFWGLYRSPCNKEGIAKRTVRICEQMIDQKCACRCGRLFRPTAHPDLDHPAAEVLVHARLMNAYGTLANAHTSSESHYEELKANAENNALQCWHLLITTSFDSYVQAQVLCCLALHYDQFKDLRRVDEAWHLLHYAATLHEIAGLSQLSILNHMSACRMRMEAGGERAHEIGQLLSDIAHQLSGKPIWVKLKHTALTMLDKHRHGKSYSEQKTFLQQTLPVSSQYHRDRIQELLHDDGLHLS